MQPGRQVTVIGDSACESTGVDLVVLEGLVDGFHVLLVHATVGGVQAEDDQVGLLGLHVGDDLVVDERVDVHAHVPLHRDHVDRRRMAELRVGGVGALALLVRSRAAERERRRCLHGLGGRGGGCRHGRGLRGRGLCGRGCRLVRLRKGDGREDGRGGDDREQLEQLHDDGTVYPSGPFRRETTVRYGRPGRTVLGAPDFSRRAANHARRPGPHPGRRAPRSAGGRRRGRASAETAGPGACPWPPGHRP